jgi:SsrA-binding protein
MKNKLVELNNKRASFEYNLGAKYQAGMVLTGTEVKSVREGKVNMSEAFCYFIKGELHVRNLHISEYRLGTHYNHEPKRLRKLLLNRFELNKIAAKAKEKGYTIVPTRIFETEKGLLKMEISLARGKKLYNKRESLKEKDNKRDLARKLSE